MTLVMTSLPLACVFHRLFAFTLVSASHWLAETWQLSHRGARGELEVEFNPFPVLRPERPRELARTLKIAKSLQTYCGPCLVPRPHYSTQPKRFGSRGPSENVRPRQKSSKVRQLNGDLNKTNVSHFKVKNTPLKHTDGKGNFKRILSFLQVDKGRNFQVHIGPGSQESDIFVNILS